MRLSMFKQHASAVYANRDFIFASIRREFELKYRNSLLGALWTVLNPLAMIVIYTLVFSKIMQARLPGLEGAYAYSIYLCAGILFWGVFSEIALRAQGVFLEQAHLLKKINFPRLCLPAIVVGSGLINFLIIFALFLVVLVLVDALPGMRVIGTDTRARHYRVVCHRARGGAGYLECVFSRCGAFLWGRAAVLVLADTDYLSRVDSSGAGAGAFVF